MKKVRYLSHIFVALSFAILCGACTLRRESVHASDAGKLRNLLKSSKSYNNLYVTQLVMSDPSIAPDLRQKKWILTGHLESATDFKKLCYDLTKHHLFEKVALNVDIKQPLSNSATHSPIETQQPRPSGHGSDATAKEPRK